MSEPLKETAAQFLQRAWNELKPMLTIRHVFSPEVTTVFHNGEIFSISHRSNIARSTVIEQEYRMLRQHLIQYLLDEAYTSDGRTLHFESDVERIYSAYDGTVTGIR